MFPEQNERFYDFQSSLLCYISNGLDPVGVTYKKCLEQKFTDINTEGLTNAQQMDLQRLASDTSTKPPEVLNWWDDVQLNSRQQRNQNHIIPEKLEDFSKSVSFQKWNKTVINISMVKRLTRVIYRSPGAFKPAMSVAVTIESQTGDLSQPVRETEVALERTDGSGNADFYTYDSKGHLGKVSEFPSGQRPSPSVCMGCHFKRNQQIFTREGM